MCDYTRKTDEKVCLGETTLKVFNNTGNHVQNLRHVLMKAQRT